MLTAEAILRIFLSGRSASYREIHRQLFYPTLPRPIKVVPKEKTVATILWRLKKQGLLKLEGGKLITTLKGKRYLEKISKRKFETYPEHGNYDEEHLNNRGRSLVVVFDIPVRYNFKRNWLRIELRFLEFEQLQHSVWMGKGPLPEKFFKKLIDFGIFDYVHVFEIKSAGTINKN